jgi:hypothetical protein
VRSPTCALTYPSTFNTFPTVRWGSNQRALRAVNAISRPQWNDGYGVDCGRSRGGPCRSAIRPIEASKAAIGYVRSTSKPAKLF